MRKQLLAGLSKSVNDADYKSGESWKSPPFQGGGGKRIFAVGFSVKPERITDLTMQ